MTHPADFFDERIDAGVVNTFYGSVKRVELGVEYSYGRGTVFDAGPVAAGIPTSNDEGTQHRVNALARYGFS